MFISIVCFHLVWVTINHNWCPLLPKEWWRVDRFWSPGSSGKHSSECLEPSENEASALGGDLAVHEGGNPAIFLGPGAVEDGFEDDGGEDLPGGLCDRT